MSYRTHLNINLSREGKMKPSPAFLTYFMQKKVRVKKGILVNTSLYSNEGLPLSYYIFLTCFLCFTIPRLLRKVLAR